MNTTKRVVWIGIATTAVVVLGVGAAFAQDDTTSPHRSNPPTIRTNPEFLPDALILPDGAPAELPEDFTPQNPPPLPPRPAYNYSVTLTCSTATRLEGETLGEVAQSYSSLRASIGSSEILAVMPGGAIFDILDGPVCSGGYHWYQVNYNGLVGWVTEGYADDYWLEPVGG